ncbi:NUC173-domain-containing protein [Basidiobolus meristosporus CBS 931.73]|uniref:NUC173-domain-containing protein n=1 Tax=Basidiobolus meristosporus CBS 931.73 TaxID=1314790 RepID=A0A1Y1YUZ5_9FUNG|nr:NUC173-domain-containing protein [Basidiobolus meristosporus CBS 931.73]|eukprot:ORY01799.1 NUC173-domain-containing protein [Basidiobolus meristosporus CBS 931.73]
MEDIFSKVRTQVNSTLNNQKLPATTLLSVEKELKEKSIELSPAAYFTSLLNLLEDQKDTEGDNENRTAIIYLLSIVFPHIPQDILKKEYSRALKTLVSTIEEHKESAPIARAVIACLESLLAAQDSAAWKKLPTKNTFNSLLQLCLDGRPKVRRRAHEAIHKIISSSPTANFQHPAAFSVAKFCIKVLKESSQSEPGSAHHILALVKPIISIWPAEELESLCETLFELPKLGNDYLTVTVLEVLQNLFKCSSGNLDEEKIRYFLDALIQMKPNSGEVQQSTAWLKCMTYGYEAYAKCNQEECSGQLGMVFAIVFADLGCDQKPVADAAAECLSGLVENCLVVNTESMDKSKNLLKKISGLLETGLRARYQSAWPGVLAIYRAFFKKLGRNAVPLLSHTIELIAELTSSDKECKKVVHETLGTIVTAIGPQTFLKILPLSQEKSKDNPKQFNRVWLLPILKESITNTELSYFVKELLPLTESLKSPTLKAATKGKQGGDKSQKAVQGIWALLPGFCHLPYDLVKAFDQDFAEVLGNVIFSEPELRPIVCTSLGTLIQKNLEFSTLETSDEELQKQYQMDKKDAVANIQHLAGFSSNFLAVFFNVFSQTPPESRTYLTEMIQLFLKISNEGDIHETFEKVHQLLADALKEHHPVDDLAPSKLPPMAHTMMDLAVIMVEFLDTASLERLMETVTALIAQEEDGVLQMMSYDAMNRMYQCENGKGVLTNNIEELQTKLLSTTLITSPVAKEERLKALANVTRVLPSSDLSFIPSIVSEAIVCTKEAKEGSRNLAYDLLVVMGNRMKEGGVIVTSKIAEMDDDAQNAEASIAEYFTMVTAGLAGSTPNMISATITSLSRLLFEFQSSLSQPIVDDLLNTIHMFVISANRELVKSALGFVKVAVLTLDSEYLKPHLSDIVTGILTWSHDHKNHFKDKVRHIFERLIRKFGYEEIARVVPEEHMELITNIKNRKERARRGKNKATDNSEDEDEDDDSDSSESEGSGDESDQGTHGRPKSRKHSRADESDDESETEGRKPGFRGKRMHDGRGNRGSFNAGNHKRGRFNRESEASGENRHRAGARDQNRRARGRGGFSDKGSQRFAKGSRPAGGEDDRRGGRNSHSSASKPRGKFSHRGSSSRRRN